MLGENIFERAHQAFLLLLFISTRAKSNPEDPNIYQLLSDIKSLLQSQSDVLEKLSSSARCMENLTHLQEQITKLQNDKIVVIAPGPSPTPPVAVTLTPHSPASSTHDLLPELEEKDVHQRVTAALPRLEGALEKLEEQIKLLYNHLVAAATAPGEAWTQAEKDVSDLHDVFGELVKHRSYMAGQEAIWERWEENLNKYNNMVNMIDVISQQFIKCREDFKQLGGTCYQYNLKDRFTLNEAMLSCKEGEARLLELRSPEEYQDVLARTKGHNVWLGLKADFLGDWRWVSNNELTKFTKWYSSPRRSKGNCAYIDNTGQTGWFNYHCTSGRKNIYRINCICESEGQNIKQFLQLKGPTEF